jgi:hypothetical protein
MRAPSVFDEIYSDEEKLTDYYAELHLHGNTIGTITRVARVLS